MAKCLAHAAVIAAALLSASAAEGEIAVAAIDGKQMEAGDAGPTPDAVAVLDITGGAVKLIGQTTAPAAMIGPPTSVAVARDNSFALVTACQKLEGGKLVPDDVMSVIDLATPAHPRVIQTLHAGPGASGVSISPDGKLALVASTDEDAISAFSISGKRLTPLAKVPIEAQSGATDVVFTPDGKTALVIGRRSSNISVLAVNGLSVTDTGRRFSTGRTPYGAVVTPDGKYLINTNSTGPAGSTTPGRGGTLAMADIASGRTAALVDIGSPPEHVVMTGDGKYVAVVVTNGAPHGASDPRWNSVFGLLNIYAVGAGTLTPVAEAKTGHWCQGATIASDDKTFIVECAAERDFEIFRLTGDSLVQDKSATIATVSRPGAIATAASR